MKIKRSLYIGFLILILPVCLCAAALPTPEEKNPGGLVSPAGLPVVSLLYKGITIIAEVANTEEARAMGLKFRKDLGKNQGMLFVFDDSQIRNFWMKDTNLPLSIAFLDESGSVLGLDEMKALTETLHPSRGPAKFALEMNTGWFTANGVQPGEKITGVLEAPVGKEAFEKPPYALDSVQLAWGKKQIQQMLQDRPEMAKYVREGDDLWDWTVSQFAGKWVKGGVEWNSENPGGDFDSTALRANPSKGKKAYIQVTQNYALKNFHPGEKKTSPALWYEMALELGNLKNHPMFEAIDNEGRAGRIGRTDYAFEYMAVEDIVTNNNGYYFFHSVWVPHCEKLGLPPQDQRFTERNGTVGPGWGKDDFKKYFEWMLKKNGPKKLTDFEAFCLKDFGGHYAWYTALYDKYAPDIFAKKGLPIPKDVPSEEIENKFLDQLIPPPSTPVPVSPEIQKAMDAIPPPP